MPSPFFGSWVPAGLTLAEGESEVEVKVAQSCLALCDPMDCMVLSDFTFTFHFHALEKAMATHSSFLPGESQGQRSLVGCRLWGCTESDTTEAT